MPFGEISVNPLFAPYSSSLLDFRSILKWSWKVIKSFFSVNVICNTAVKPLLGYELILRSILAKLQIGVFHLPYLQTEDPVLTNSGCPWERSDEVSLDLSEHVKEIVQFKTTFGLPINFQAGSVCSANCILSVSLALQHKLTQLCNLPGNSAMIKTAEEC